MFQYENIWDCDEKQDFLNEKLFGNITIGGNESGKSYKSVKSNQGVDKKKSIHKNKTADKTYNKQEKDHIINNPDDQTNLDEDHKSTSKSNINEANKLKRKRNCDDTYSNNTKKTNKKKKKKKSQETIDQIVTVDSDLKEEQIKQLSCDDTYSIDTKKTDKKKKKKKSKESMDQTISLDSDVNEEQIKQSSCDDTYSNDTKKTDKKKKKENSQETIDQTVTVDSDLNEEQVNKQSSCDDTYSNDTKKTDKKKKKKKSQETIDQTVLVDLDVNEEQVKQSSCDTPIQSYNNSNHMSPQNKQKNINRDERKSLKESKHVKSLRKLTNRLEGSHFRWINEKLYTIRSNEAYKMFNDDPNLFDIYHKGFVTQVHSWPENPVDIVIQKIKQKKDGKLVIADFGCGDAVIARSISNQVHSFDLVATNKNVTACDMRMVPLQSGVIDVAVFCLSLMGTNISDFIFEANRVLKLGGSLQIAEVKSRIQDIDLFINSVEQLGFNHVQMDDSNKMFVWMEFKKISNSKNDNISISLKPCIYKRR